MNNPTKKAICLFTFLFTAFCLKVSAQAPASLLDGLHPVSPTAWQFSKYTDLPVSEYTGVPNIVIPLYEIEADGVKVPLDLTYHATGIKVNEDASWVGLGWDMQIGSIVQTVNNNDDLNSFYTKWQPDWPSSSDTIALPWRYNYPFSTSNSAWHSPYPSSTPNPVQPYDAFNIAADYYVPVNTDFTIRRYNQFAGSPQAYDTEPDVFKANFLGHSINFVLDWNTSRFVVLNKKGYQVTYNSTNMTWSIIVPSGEEFDFQQKIASTGNSSDFTLQASSSSSITSNTWMLTKIITKNKQQITFNYSVTPGTYQSYPTYTQKVINASLSSSGGYFGTGDPSTYFGYNAYSLVLHAGNNICYDLSNSAEQYAYLSSIVFPTGQVNFTTSSRQDMVGAMKLDSIAVIAAQPVKTYKLNYTYFNAGNIGGTGYAIDTTVHNSITSNYRLELLSLKDNSGATHNFTYNSTPLPKKNSFATDYWGYYNGQVSNTSMVPNASQFNNASYTTIFGNNGDNHSANVTYAQAGILQQIKYPTGGTVNFNYELNAFNNYYVPDFSTSTNTISHGNGLRVQSITYNQADGSQSKKDSYTYSTGKAILPISVFRFFPLAAYYLDNPIGTLSINNWNMTELNMNGVFSSSMFGSLTGVGYDTVSKQQLDLSNNPQGKTVSVFYNNPDLIGLSAGTLSQLSATLPALRQYNVPENGSLKSEMYYDQSNNLLKKSVNSYSISLSTMYYGARLFGYSNFLVFNFGYLNTGPPSFLTYDQHMIGYYPLFDIETLQTTSTETEYFGTDSLRNITSNTYDTYNQLASVTKTNSNNVAEASSFTYPYNSGSNSVLTAMVSANRLKDMVTMTRGTANSSYSFVRTFQQLGSLFLPANDNVNNHGTSGIGIPTITTYDQFDANNGNLFQYTKSSLTNSFLYDYNKQYVIAEVKNAPYTSIAYTSFEADGTGRWKFTGAKLPDNTAITGKQDYSLANGNIYRDSLVTTQTYIVSYWSKNGAQTVNGSTTSIQGYTYNGWTYYEHTIVNPTGGTITLSGTGRIDELRLYPSTAQMATYTYEPLVGVTSISDVSGKISYYEYDASMRLLDIRDQSKNILKAFCYNYAGQLTNCGVNTLFLSAAQSVPFTKSCSSGYTGTSSNYNLTLGQYTSTMSLADANNQANADVAANGQNYANNNGSCLLNITVTLSNTTGAGYQVNFSSGTINQTYNFLNSGNTTVQVPTGTYIVTVYPTGAYNNHTIGCTGQTSVVAPRTSFTGVNVTTSPAITVSIQ